MSRDQHDLVLERDAIKWVPVNRIKSRDHKEIERILP